MASGRGKFPILCSLGRFSLCIGRMRGIMSGGNRDTGGGFIRERACFLADAVATSCHVVVQRAQARAGMTVALVGVGRYALPMARLAGA